MKIDELPVVQARWYGQGPAERQPRVIVIHDMEAPEKGDTAENVARYFATLGEATKASAHVCVDNNSAVRCVSDDDIAYAAPGANADGLQIELAGYGRQSAADWADDYSTAMLDIAAGIVAEWCERYAIPPTHLDNDELSSGARGIVGHFQVSAVYQRSDHTDPGVHFPWEHFLSRVSAHMAP